MGKKEDQLTFRKNEIQKKKMNFERTLFDQSTYPEMGHTKINIQKRSVNNFLLLFSKFANSLT
jgi:hypothetical protein